jgi:hypothetical protein
MSPFTKEVLESLEFLRRAIADVAHCDAEAAETLTAITDDLVVNMENQMLLVFANVGVKRKSDEQALLQSRADQSLLEQYHAACAGHTEVNTQADGKVTIPNHREPIPVISPSGLSEAEKFLPDVAVQRTLLGSIHCTLEATGHSIGAERVCLYLAQKGTGTLRVLCCAPDASAAKRGAFLPAHQGAIGSCFSTGIAIRADSPTVEVRKTFIEPLDAQLGFATDNFMAFPVIDPASGQTVGVLECANKSGCFSEDNENLLACTCRLLWYLVCYHELDMHNGVVFNPGPLHAIRPFRTPTFEELKGYHGAAGTHPKQLVARLESTSKPSVTETVAKHLGLGSKPADVPAAVRGPSHTPDNVVPAGGALTQVRELHSYLSKVEDAHKQAMSELVQTQRREDALREDCSKKAAKLRVLEENTQALHDQLNELRNQLNRQSFAPMRDSNSMDFGSNLGTFLTNDSRLASPPPIQRETSSDLPQIHKARAQAGAGDDPKALMSTAAGLLAELRRVAGPPAPSIAPKSKTPPPVFPKSRTRKL